MPGTTAHGLPYPAPGDPLRDGAVKVADLAATLEAQLYTESSTAVVEVAGWAIMSQRLTRIGPAAILDLVVQNNTGAALAAGATGNIGDVTVAQLPSGSSAWAPLVNAQRGHTFSARAVNNTWSGYISAAGNIRIADGPPNTSMAAGDQFGINVVYRLANI